jgi:hypothetical protein
MFSKLIGGAASLAPEEVTTIRTYPAGALAAVRSRSGMRREVNRKCAR